MIDIQNLTLGQINEIKGLTTQSGSHPYRIGKNYFIRTVTYFFTGKLVEVHPFELVIEDVSWIPDTGRYSDSFKTGEHNEVEPVDGRVIVGRYSIIDFTEWNNPLPRKQK